MLTKKELKKIAKARLKDAEVLLSGKRFDGAVYLCGYVIELGLKAKICKTLSWEGYPASNNEFSNYKSFRTHDLDVLLHLSGVEELIKFSLLYEWSMISQWNPMKRYQPIGDANKKDAEDMIKSAATLLKIL